MAAVPFCLGFLSEPRIARMGYDANPPFLFLCPIALGTSPLFRTWLGGGRGLRLNCGLRGWH